MSSPFFYYKLHRNLAAIWRPGSAMPPHISSLCDVGLAGYVEQFDTLLPELTVTEMLLYTAELKCPVSVTPPPLCHTHPLAPPP